MLDLLQKKEVYDRLIVEWSTALDAYEFKVLAVLTRMTVGFARAEIKLSLAQFQHGVRLSDDTGWWLPPMNLPLITIRRSLERLEARGLLAVVRTPRRASSYAINLNWSTDMPLAIPKSKQVKPAVERYDDGSSIDTLVCSQGAKPLLSQSTPVCSQRALYKKNKGEEEREDKQLASLRSAPDETLKISELADKSKTVKPVATENLTGWAKVYRDAFVETFPRTSPAAWGGKEKGNVKSMAGKWTDKQHPFSEFLNFCVREFRAVRSSREGQWLQTYFPAEYPSPGMLCNDKVFTTFANAFISLRAKRDAFDRSDEAAIEQYMANGKSREEAIQLLGEAKGAARERAKLTTAQHDEAKRYSDREAAKEARFRASRNPLVRDIATITAELDARRAADKKMRGLNSDGSQMAPVKPVAPVAPVEVERDYDDTMAEFERIHQENKDIPWH